MPLNARSGSRGSLRLVSTGLLAALALSTSACYQQVPLVTPTPAPGTRVVARLTPQGSAEMAPLIGAGASAVEGIVLRSESTQWELSMLRVEQVAGTDVMWNREPVSFPAGALGVINERRFQTQRSYIAGGLITAGVILLGRLFASSVFSGDGGGDGPPNPPQ